MGDIIAYLRGRELVVQDGGDTVFRDLLLCADDSREADTALAWEGYVRTGSWEDHPVATCAAEVADVRKRRQE